MVGAKWLEYKEKECSIPFGICLCASVLYVCDKCVKNCNLSFSAPKVTHVTATIFFLFFSFLL